MSKHIRNTILILAITASVASAAQHEIPWKEDADDPTLISMGPVGARAKTDHLFVGLPESHSSSGVIKYIFKNSPADGKLQLEDVVTGVNGAPFNKDFSRRLGAAIDQSEGTTGKLSLNILRQGKPLTVEFDVPKIGSFSKTFPYACKKSDAILEAACDWLVKQQWPNGKLEGDRNSGYSVLTAVTGLAWLGSGNPKYQKNIDLIVNYFFDYFTTKRTSDGHFGPVSLEGWQVEYGAMFLSEYYFATGDPRVPPMLAYLNREIDRLQFRHLDAETVAFLNNQHPKDGVPPYWFGHALLTTKHTGVYFHLGVNVANALVAWGLMDECGVVIDRDNLAKTMDYIEVASPSGQMTYAGRPNQRGNDSDGFGRTGVLAVANHLQNNRPQYTRKVLGILERDYEKRCFISHSSAVMGKSWGMLGIAALDPKLFRKAMDNFKYDYDLTRLHDGRFVANPAHWNQEGHPQCDLKGAYGNGHRWTTAFNAFIFTLSKQRSRLAGGSPRVFGVDPTTLNGAPLAAFNAMKVANYPAAIATLSTAVPLEKTTGAPPGPAERLMNCIGNMAVSDWQEIDALWQKKDVCLAWSRLTAHEKSFGKLPGQAEKIAGLKAACNKPENVAQWKIGSAYYAIVNNAALSKENKLAELKRFAAANATSPYAAFAQEHIRKLQP